MVSEAATNGLGIVSCSITLAGLIAAERKRPDLPPIEQVCAAHCVGIALHDFFFKQHGEEASLFRGAIRLVAKSSVSGIEQGTECWVGDILCGFCDCP